MSLLFEGERSLLFRVLLGLANREFFLVAPIKAPLPFVEFFKLSFFLLWIIVLVLQESIVRIIDHVSRREKYFEQRYTAVVLCQVRFTSTLRILCLELSPIKSFRLRKSYSDHFNTS